MKLQSVPALQEPELSHLSPEVCPFLGRAVQSGFATFTADVCVFHFLFPSDHLTLLCCSFLWLRHESNEAQRATGRTCFRRSCFFNFCYSCSGKMTEKFCCAMRSMWPGKICVVPVEMKKIGSFPIHLNTLDTCPRCIQAHNMTHRHIHTYIATLSLSYVGEHKPPADSFVKRLYCLACMLLLFYIVHRS